MPTSLPAGSLSFPSQNWKRIDLCVTFARLLSRPNSYQWLQTLSESRLRAKYEAEMQQLPENVHAQPHVALEGPKCDACGLEVEYEDNIILQCDGPCRTFVHQACAGVLTRPRGSWVCQMCKLGESATLVCLYIAGSGNTHEIDKVSCA